MYKDWPFPVDNLNDCVNVMIYILDKAIQCDAFSQYVAQLKEQRFTLTKNYASKINHNSGKNGSNGNLSKPRYDFYFCNLLNNLLDIYECRVKNVFELSNNALTFSA